MPRAKATPYRKGFVLVVGSRVRSVDVEALRARIGGWLAARAARSPRHLTGCRTIQGPGNVIICQGDCRKPGEVCDVKVTRLPGGGYSFTCACQKPIMQPLARRRAKARAAGG
jgi:hypothetical protein